jgi:hypothetical protein
VDEAVALLGLSCTPGPLADLPQVYYEEVMQIRVADKLQQIRATAPGWVAGGGELAALEAQLAEFQRRMQLAIREWEIYYLRSLDGGGSWEPARRLTLAAGASQRPSLAVDAGIVQVVWFDDRDGEVEVYAKRSDDQGASWGPDLRLTRAAGNSILPSVAAAAGVVHVVWSDDRTGNEEIFYRRSSD